MSKEEMTIITISLADKERIEQMRKIRENPLPRQNRRETARDVIHRILDALEEEEDSPEA